MLWTPMSSPQMTRMLGFLPEPPFSWAAVLVKNCLRPTPSQQSPQESALAAAAGGCPASARRSSASRPEPASQPSAAQATATTGIRNLELHNIVDSPLVRYPLLAYRANHIEIFTSFSQVYQRSTTRRTIRIPLPYSV